jgi:hypothetical protein
MTRSTRSPAALEWATFLPLVAPNVNDQAQGLDPVWCYAKGIYPGADAVFRGLRDDVSPLIKCLKQSGVLAGFHFLIHDRNSGVPAEASDGAYIHLRLRFKKPTATFFDMIRRKFRRFQMTRPVVARQDAIAGFDLRIVKGGKTNVDKVKLINRLIDQQSEWMLALVDAHEWKDDVLMVHQARQFLHLFSNMTQIKVG